MRLLAKRIRAALGHLVWGPTLNFFLANYRFSQRIALRSVEIMYLGEKTPLNTELMEDYCWTVSSKTVKTKDNIFAI